MPLRPCLRCGIPTRNGSWCPQHRPVWAQPSPSSRATRRGWNPLRARVLARDGHACRRCASTTDLAVHHVVAVADGGPNSLDNLITLCARCHRAAHGPGDPAAA